MPETVIRDARASHTQVAAQRAALRQAASQHALERPRLRHDGTVIVHATDRGYGSLARFAAEAATIVGTYVHVIPDDTPAGSASTPAL